MGLGSPWSLCVALFSFQAYHLALVPSRPKVFYEDLQDKSPSTLQPHLTNLLPLEKVGVLGHLSLLESWLCDLTALLEIGLFELCTLSKL